jgi:hypothetical protein
MYSPPTAVQQHLLLLLLLALIAFKGHNCSRHYIFCNIDDALINS